MGFKFKALFLFFYPVYVIKLKIANESPPLFHLLKELFDS